MNKRICPVILAISFFGTVESNAQMQIGIMAGPQFSTRGYNDQIAQNTFIVGVNAGLSAFLPLSKDFSLHNTLGYSGKGVVLKDFPFMDNIGNDIGVANVNILIHYVELRLPVNYITKPSSKSKFLFGGGPYFAYAVGGYQKVSRNERLESIFKKTELDFENEYTRFEFGAVAELNLLMTQKMVLGLSADFGLSNVFRTDNVSKHHFSLSLTLGYLFLQTGLEKK